MYLFSCFVLFEVFFLSEFESYNYTVTLKKQPLKRRTFVSGQLLLNILYRTYRNILLIKLMVIILCCVEKERLSVKRCCYFYNIGKTREDSQTVLLYELHRTKKGKTKTMLFYKAFSKTVTLYLLLLYVLYRRDRGIQSLKPCCYYLLNRADKKILLVNLCCNIYCIVRSSVV